MQHKTWFAVAVVAAVGLTSPSSVRGGAVPATVVKIGLVKTLFRDTPESLIQVLSTPLCSLMKMQTGYTGKLRTGGDAFEMAELLEKGTIHLGVFHGHEYAWIRKKHPDLVPLVVPIKSSEAEKVCLVVTKASKIGKVDSLKGKTIGLPYRSKGHLYLFLERRCCCDAPSIDAHFREVTEDSDEAGTLDDLIDRYVDGVIIEKADLEAYRKKKPKSYKKLEVLIESEAFPPGVLLYKKGALSAEMIKKFRSGLISAHQNSKGKMLLKLSRLKGFGPVPANFDKLLENINKAYPAPSEE